MRVPSFSYPQSLATQLQKLNSQQIQMQKQLSTGQKIETADQDPRAMGRALDALTEKSQIQSQNANLTRGLTISEFSLASYEQLKILSNEASRLANNSDGMTNSSDYRSRSLQVNQLLEQSLRILNTRLGGDFIFGGANTAQTPFEETRDADGNIVSVTYNGTTQPEQDVQFRIGEGAQIAPFSKGTSNAEIADWVNNLISFRDALAAEDLETVQTLVPDLEAADETILVNLVEFGSMQESMNITRKINEARFNELERMVSSELDVDTAQAIIRLNQMQLSYQAALQSSSRILQQSLLDYI